MGPSVPQGKAAAPGRTHTKCAPRSPFLNMKLGSAPSRRQSHGLPSVGPMYCGSTAVPSEPPPCILGRQADEQAAAGRGWPGGWGHYFLFGPTDVLPSPPSPIFRNPQIMAGVCHRVIGCCLGLPHPTLECGFNSVLLGFQSGSLQCAWEADDSPRT